MADSSADAPTSRKLGNLALGWDRATRQPGKTAGGARASGPPPRPAGGADAPTSRKLGNLAIVWDRATRYPGKIAGAAIALLAAAGAALAIPGGVPRGAA